MKSILCALVIVLAFLVAVLATWFVLSNMHEPAARAESCYPSPCLSERGGYLQLPTPDAGAPDADDIIWKTSIAIDKAQMIGAQKGFLRVLADQDIRIEWQGKTTQLRDLLRDIARLKREVRELQQQKRKPVLEYTQPEETRP